jgi:hypothetical protein
MTTYKELFGKAVKYLSTDPTTEAEGQVWYNSTSGTFKSLLATAAWSSSSNLGTARYGAAGAGTQTASLIFGGNYPVNTAATEEYNGSGWSVGGNLGTARYRLGGAGTQTAGLAIAGAVTGVGYTNASEEYNGTAWTAGGNLNTARDQLTGCGLQTAALAIGGAPPISTATEEYNGTSWTVGGNLGTARNFLAATGLQTAALAFGGNLPPNTAATEEYNGTSWTVGGSLGTAKRQLAGAGIQTAALAFGGYTTVDIAATEEYDGTNWTTSPASLATAKNSLCGCGTQAAALAMSGRPTPTAGTQTEEYNFSASIITGAAWASGANMPANTSQGAGSGTQTAALITGGKTGPGGGSLSTQTVEYDGSAWTAGGAYPAPSTQMGAFGIQTATVCMGGDQPSQSPTVTNVANAYNGTSWTSISAMNNYRYNIVGQGVGVQTAGLIAGGDDGITSPVDDLSAVEEYNGSTWTAATGLSTARGGSSVNIGTQTACIAAYGTNPGAGGPPGFPTWFDNTEIYNGLAWTAGPKTNTLRRAGIGSSGTLTNGIAFGGYFNPITNLDTAEKYDGTSWSSSANLATARAGIGSADSSGDAALGAGGYTGVTSNAVEEFTGETSALNYKTITTS